MLLSLFNPGGIWLGLDERVLSVSISKTDTLLHLWSLVEDALVDTDNLSYKLGCLFGRPIELNLLSWKTELRY